MVWGGKGNYKHLKKNERKRCIIISRKGSKDKEFFVKTLSEDSGALTYENYYTNIRHKTKQIEMFKKQAECLGECEDAQMLLQHCDELQQEINELMDLFRGKITVKHKTVIYVPMDIRHAFDYLGYLVNEDIDANIHTIRNLMNAMEYETGTTQEDKNQIKYYRKLVNYFKDRFDKNAKPSTS